MVKIVVVKYPAAGWLVVSDEGNEVLHKTFLYFLISPWSYYQGGALD